MYDLHSSFLNNTYSICRFIHLRKSFDTVDVTLLLNKLYKYTIRDTCNKLKGFYLSSRQQYVVVNCVASEVLPMPIGVPQGSVLGLFVFPLLINDIVSFSKVKSVLFADDVAFCVNGNTLDEALGKMEILRG